MRIYTASKLNKAHLWRDLVSAWPEVTFTARWPTLHVGVTPDEPCYAKVFWQHDLEDVLAADGVLLYAEPEDHLRGALVEAGMAIATGRFVVVVGEHDDYGTWQYHPLVYKVGDLESARLLLKTMAARA